jgi:hypothetical protein
VKYFVFEDLPPQAPSPYWAVKVYGRAAALCMCEATRRGSDEKTVNIEGALALGRVYDWKNKIIVQLSATEMYQLLAVLEKRMAHLELRGHGTAHDKSLSIEIQQQGYFVKLSQRGRPLVAVPVPGEEAIRLKSMLYRQIMANEPHLTIEGVRALLPAAHD